MDMVPNPGFLPSFAELTRNTQELLRPRALRTAKMEPLTSSANTGIRPVVPDDMSNSEHTSNPIVDITML